MFDTEEIVVHDSKNDEDATTVKSNQRSFLERIPEYSRAKEGDELRDFYQGVRNKRLHVTIRWLDRSRETFFELVVQLVVVPQRKGWIQRPLAHAEEAWLPPIIISQVDSLLIIPILLDDS